MDVVGTPAWMLVVEPRRERRPRATHDHREVGGSVTPGAYIEQFTEEAQAEGRGEVGEIK